MDLETVRRIMEERIEEYEDELEELVRFRGKYGVGVSVLSARLDELCDLRDMINKVDLKPDVGF